MDLAGKIDRALTVGDVDLAEFTRFTPYTCPGNFFPGAGPNCAPAETGGVAAIVIGAYNSEGDVYDLPSYSRYLTDWTYDALGDASDEFGDGRARVYAIADMPEEYEGFQGELGTLEVIATRIAPSPVKGAPIRETLTFHVAGTSDGWLITHLLRGPASFLDPKSQDAASSFLSWQRWTASPTPGALASRWKPGRGSRQLAYLDASGALTVASADGSSTRTVAQGVCKGTTTGKNEVAWSADAQRIAVACAGSERGKLNVEIYGADGSGPRGLIEDVSSYAWSPEGHRVAYQTTDASGGTLSASVRVRDPDTGEDSLVTGNAILLDWPRPQELLLGLNPVSQSGAYFETYEASFYNITTGATLRVQRFDNQQQFWLAPPANRAIVLDGPANRKDAPGVRLAVYDIASGAETALGWGISYGAESIPRRNIVVSPGESDGFIWADFTTGIQIAEGAPDGSHATLLDRLQGEIYSMSSDALVLYSPPAGGPAGLSIRDLVSGAETNWPQATTGAIAPPAGQP